MTAQTASAGDPAQHQEIARILLAARKEARALPAFPGPLPETLAEAYAIQEAAIALKGLEIVGWKVGRVPPAAAQILGVDHLAGPIYAGLVWEGGAAPTPFGAISGGFCAIEAEFVFALGSDADPDKTAWTPDEAAAVAGALHIGIEVAGSPIANLNALGTRAVIADGGANAGLILGPEIPGWRGRDAASMPCETFVDGRAVGSGSAASLLGGPLGSLAFILGHLAARGRPGRAGQLIATGQTTGIHDIAAGQEGRVSFAALGEIRCVARQA